MSRFDHLYRRIILSKFFTKGWGKPDNLKRLFEFRKIISDRSKCQHLVSSDYPVHIDKDEAYGEYRILEGHFTSPLKKYLPGVMPKEVEIAKFQVLLPQKWKTKLKPVCLHLAGTGDHFFWRRRNLIARPLLKEAGIGSILLENPYYGYRKPKSQTRSSLQLVSDLFVMGGALVLESLVLFHWCERQGLGPLGITGISMGGHMASLAATNWHKPISLIPCLSWSTASCVFTEGVMSDAIPWNVLQSQYYEETVYEREIRHLLQSPERDGVAAYNLGHSFIQNYSQTIEDIKDAQAKYENTDENTDHLKPKTNTTSENSKPYVEDQERQKSNEMQARGGDSTNSKSKQDIQMIKSLGNSKQSQFRFYATSQKEQLTRNKNTSNVKSKDRKNSRTLKDEAVDFMIGVMDECTHLGNFSTPVDTSLIIIVTAKKDAYVPRDNVLSLEDLWPGSEVRYVDAGHVIAFLLHQEIFRKAIVDSFTRQTQKYYS